MDRSHSQRSKTYFSRYEGISPTESPPSHHILSNLHNSPTFFACLSSTFVQTLRVRQGKSLLLLWKKQATLSDSSFRRKRSLSVCRAGVSAQTVCASFARFASQFDHKFAMFYKSGKTTERRRQISDRLRFLRVPAKFRHRDQAIFRQFFQHRQISDREHRVWWENYFFFILSCLEGNKNRPSLATCGKDLQKTDNGITKNCQRVSFSPTSAQNNSDLTNFTFMVFLTFKMTFKFKFDLIRPT